MSSFKAVSLGVLSILLFSAPARSGVWTGFGSRGCETGSIRDAVFLSNGDMVVGGYFSMCGGIPASNVARWQASTNTWHPLGSGAQNGVTPWNRGVNALATDGVDVYVGGSFTHAGGAATPTIAKWNSGTDQWSQVGGGGAHSANAIIYTLHYDSGTLYAGGTFSAIDGVGARNIAMFSVGSNSWSPLNGSGSGVNSTVNALVKSGSLLYAGGNFTCEIASGTGNCVSALNKVAAWNGAWTNLAPGFTSGIVDALEMHGTSLYAGGRLSSIDGVSVSNLARYDGNWHTVGGGVSGAGVPSVDSIHSHGGLLYVGGAFQTAGGIAVNNIAQFDGASWVPLMSSGVNGVQGRVWVLETNPNSSALLVAGGFNYAGNVLVRFVADWTP